MRASNGGIIFQKRLRGCIGNMFGTRSLAGSIRLLALESALKDSRFDSLTVDELEKVGKILKLEKMVFF